MAALKTAMQKLDAAKIKYHHHIGVGEAAEVISQYATEKGCDQIIMGTRGHGIGVRAWCWDRWRPR